MPMNANHMANKKSIRFVDTTIRDGQQSLWGLGMSAGMMMPIADRLDAAGFDAIELITGASFKKLVTELKENPWDLIREVGRRMPKTPKRVIASRINLFATGTPGALLATGSMVIGRTPGFYRSELSATVPRGTFFIAVNHTAQSTYLANLASGTSYAQPTAYWRRSGIPWTTTGMIPRPSYLVYYRATYSGGTPQIDFVGRPVSGYGYRVNLSGARPNALSSLVLGISNAQWGRYLLPLDLGFLGFQPCKLYTSADFYLGHRVNSVGDASQYFSIPLSSQFLGLTFYNQWYVFDSGVSRGIAFSDALSSTVGNQ